MARLKFYPLEFVLIGAIIFFGWASAEVVFDRLKSDRDRIRLQATTKDLFERVLVREWPRFQSLNTDWYDLRLDSQGEVCPPSAGCPLWLNIRRDGERWLVEGASEKTSILFSAVRSRSPTSEDAVLCRDGILNGFDASENAICIPRSIR